MCLSAPPPEVVNDAVPSAPAPRKLDQMDGTRFQPAGKPLFALVARSISIFLGADGSGSQIVTVFLEDTALTGCEDRPLLFELDLLVHATC